MSYKHISMLAIAMIAGFSISAQQLMQGAEATAICKGSKTVQINRQSRVPSFITFREDSRFAPTQIMDVLRPALKMQLADGMRSRSVMKDGIGFTHERFSQSDNGR